MQGPINIRWCIVGGGLVCINNNVSDFWLEFPLSNHGWILTILHLTETFHCFVYPLGKSQACTLSQRCKTPGCQSRLGENFCTLTPNIFGPAIMNLLHVTLLPRSGFWSSSYTYRMFMNLSLKLCYAHFLSHSMQSLIRSWVKFQLVK